MKRLENPSKIAIQLIAAFKGVKFIKMPFVLGSNNLNPILILRENHITYRNLFLKSNKTYECIETVDVFISKSKLFNKLTTNICLYFKDSIFTFVGNTNDLEGLRMVVNLLKNKDCSLSKKANDLI